MSTRAVFDFAPHPRILAVGSRTGYATIQGHFQGSSAERVAYIDENLPSTDRRRMRYTGYTRAEHEIYAVA